MKSHSEDWLKSILATAPTKALQRLVEDTVCVLDGAHVTAGDMTAGRCWTHLTLISRGTAHTHTHTRRHTHIDGAIAVPLLPSRLLPGSSNCLLSINDQLRPTSFSAKRGAHSLFVCLLLGAGGKDGDFFFFA